MYMSRVTKKVHASLFVWLNQKRVATFAIGSSLETFELFKAASILWFELLETNNRRLSHLSCFYCLS